jgi:putative chitinase
MTLETATKPSGVGAANPGGMIAAASLQSLAPSCPTTRLTAIAEALSRDAVSFGVSTPLRLAHFLAQVAHESAGFTQLEENLSYSTERLMQVWPSRFPTREAANPFARQPFALAERVYGRRLGNRVAGDGWRYRGRGLIQITGRETYASMALLAGLDLETTPSLATDPANATRIALAFWRWKACDALADANDLIGITRRINGGLTGLDDRTRWLARAKQLFAVDPKQRRDPS